MNHRLHGGCQVPIAAYATQSATADGAQLHLQGLVGAVDGKEILRADASGPADDPEALGREVAEALLAQGAGALLAALHDD